MSTFWYYRADNPSPRVTPEFLARQRRLLLPAAYAREHQNQWVDQADAFTTMRVTGKVWARSTMVPWTLAKSTGASRAP